MKCAAIFTAAWGRGMLVLSLLLTSLPATCLAKTQDAAGHGAFQVTLTQRSPVSPLTVVSERLGWSIDAMRKSGQQLEYDLAKELFEVYVPAGYDGSTAYGLLVWVSSGTLPVEGWRDVLDRNKLIWIAPLNAGNWRYPTCRVGLALDAAFNMKSRYRIDEGRVYIAGFSGGGRISSMLGVGFPDVFAGGIYICGCDFHRQVPAEYKGKVWARNFFPPPAALFKLAKTRSRHVLLTGEKDINRSQTKSNFEAFKSDGFRHVSYFEVPAMDHQLPDAQWFEKGIAALDEPPDSAATRSVASTKVVAGTRPATAPAEDDARQAERELKAARLYIDSALYPQARERLRRIMGQHPNTAAAAEAKRLMEEIGGK